VLVKRREQTEQKHSHCTSIRLLEVIFAVTVAHLGVGDNLRWLYKRDPVKRVSSLVQVIVILKAVMTYPARYGKGPHH